jgi:hypothetical protein
MGTAVTNPRGTGDYDYEWPVGSPEPLLRVSHLGFQHASTPAGIQDHHHIEVVHLASGRLLASCTSWGAAHAAARLLDVEE